MRWGKLRSGACASRRRAAHVAKEKKGVPQAGECPPECLFGSVGGDSKASHACFSRTCATHEAAQACRVHAVVVPAQVVCNAARQSVNAVQYVRRYVPGAVPARR